MTIERFHVRVDDSTLDDLRLRLTQTRFPDQIEDTGWEYGTPIDYLRELVEYWRDEYDWRAQEARLNELEHFRTRIDGQSIHFVHARSAHADALPLLLVHGWPGSVVEFLDVIPRLTDPGGPRRPRRGRVPRDRALAAGLRLLRAPAHPGLGRAPHRAGVRRADGSPGLPRATARRAATGEPRSRPGSRRSIRGTARRSISTCRSPALPRTRARSPTRSRPTSPRWRASSATRRRYAQVQGTKPQTLGMALNDSPAGLLSWIVEKFRTWSDCDGDPETVFTRDQLITNVMLYWVTQTITSSARLYWETMHSGVLQEPLEYVSVPTGVARYPKEEILRFPRSWVEQRYNVTHWAVMPRGGHFAAMEQPELFVDDLRTFFRTVR